MRGLVLEGGGAKGAFHCGAIKALYDNGYSFDGVAGTSIGAINGALIVQDQGYGQLFDLWENVTASDISDFDNNEVTKLNNHEFSKESAIYWVKQALKTVSNSGVPTDKAISYLKRVIDEEAVRRSPMDYAIVTYCISEKKPLELFKEDIPVGELHDFIFASAYYPVFRLNKLNGKYYVDGGVYDNLPLNVLPGKKPYDEIFAIRTMSRMPHKELQIDNVNIRYICPSEDLGQTADLNRKHINKNIKLGYYDTLRILRGFSGCRYYISGDTDLFAKIFQLLTEKQLEVVQKIFDVKSGNFSSKIKTVNKKYSTCNEPYLPFFEYIAKTAEIEKFKVYSQKDFLEEILRCTDTILQKEKEKKIRKQHVSTKQLSVYKEIYPTIKEILSNESN